ncbi:MAG TPA: thiamine biosynthesis protein ThiS [Gammaproteobacteria bacterium]|nr:thiamine biosynthesis protein ThiS [Gammaproteobacteria bacterium]HAU06877.1 thiamine biosynthesis protein ThiS [Gammaproteobacteria bacterium]
MNKNMTVNFNGTPCQTEKGISLHHFIEQQPIQQQRFIVMLNNELVVSSAYSKTYLMSEDKVELVTPITGG